MLHVMLKFLRRKCKRVNNVIHYENTPMQYTEIFKVVENENFWKRKMIFFHFLLKTYIVGTRKNRFGVTSTNNLCLEQK